MKELTAKQRRFIEEYAACKNATQAAIKAGYSEKAATAIGAENLRKPQIREAVDKQLNRLQERTEVTAARVITRLAEEADFRGKGASHSARVSALSWLGKHFDLFVERHAHEGEIDLHVDSDARDFARQLGGLAERLRAGQNGGNVAGGDVGEPSRNGPRRASRRAG